jgi:hypothetical protein
LSEESTTMSTDECRSSRLPDHREVVPALVISHPGHELRIHHWLELAKPRVFVLTDGSGLAGKPRLASTADVIRRAGAKPGRIFGRLTDRALYTAILDRDHQLLVNLAMELADLLDEEGIDFVVSDAAEGIETGHDICREIVGAALGMLGRRDSRPIQALDFPLYGPPNVCPPHLRDQAVWVHLDDEALERKIQEARRYTALAEEVDEALSIYGVDAFRIECLRPMDTHGEVYEPPEIPPFYERYGMERVAAGAFDRPIGYREHILPLAQAIRRSEGARVEQVPAMGTSPEF